MAGLIWLMVLLVQSASEEGIDTSRNSASDHDSMSTNIHMEVCIQNGILLLRYNGATTLTVAVLT